MTINRQSREFYYNIVIIGGGAAGLVTAYVSAATGARVALIEKHRMGGDCLNTGCVPSKALIRTARFLREARRAEDLGIRRVETEFDFAEVMERVQRVVGQVEPHDSVQRYTALGVDCMQGQARLLSPHEVEVNGRVLRTRNIVIATGAGPLVPPIPGLGDISYLTSDTVWDLRELPQRMLILGGGAIGCELAQCFAAFGSQVTIVEMAPRLLMREDADVSAELERTFAQEGIQVLTGWKASAFYTGSDMHRVTAERGGERREIEFDQVLVAVGRKPHTAGLGLEELGVALNPGGTIETDPCLRTRVKNIYACGDVAGPYQLTHAAGHQGWHAAVNALFGGFKRFRVDYSAMPHAVFTEPEIARVGLNELDAEGQGIAYETTRYELADLDRAIADTEDRGFIKVLTVPGKDRILGATVLGSHAADQIGQFTAAMGAKWGLARLLRTIHPYPSYAEAAKLTAGQWRREHAPQKLLQWVERYHRFLRG